MSATEARLAVTRGWSASVYETSRCSMRNRVLKILGRAEIFEGARASEWIERVREPGYKAPIERVFAVRIEAFDWNSPQYITPRFTAEQIQEALAPFERRLKDLEQENKRLREDLALSASGQQESKL